MSCRRTTTNAWNRKILPDIHRLRSVVEGELRRRAGASGSSSRVAGNSEDLPINKNIKQRSQRVCFMFIQSLLRAIR